MLAIRSRTPVTGKLLRRYTVFRSSEESALRRLVTSVGKEKPWSRVTLGSWRTRAFSRPRRKSRESLRLYCASECKGGDGKAEIVSIGL